MSKRTKFTIGFLTLVGIIPLLAFKDKGAWTLLDVFINIILWYWILKLIFFIFDKIRKGKVGTEVKTNE